MKRPENEALETSRQNEDRYRLAIRATRCAIWDWNQSTDQIIWAGSFEDLFGYRPEQVGSTYQWWQERVHPEDYRRVRAHFILFMEHCLSPFEEQKDKPWTIEYRFRRVDGGYATVESVHSLCGVADGEALRMIGVINGITSRKLDEDRLRRSEARLARAQRLTSLGSFEFDGQSGEVQLSDEAYRVFGVERENFTHSVDAIRALIDPADIGGVIGLAQFIGARDAGLATRACDFRMIRANGEVRFVRRECDPVIGPAGTITGFFGTFQDITNIRAAEEQRRELQAQLMQAQRMESLGTLAGGIAHDLNNTLVPVINLAELIRRNTPADSADRELLDVIRQSGERARDLVSQILIFSRGQEPDKHELDLEAFLKQIMRLIRASVLTSIQIDERIEAVPLVLANKGQMHQIVLNLVTNAAQAISTGVGTITVELTTAGSEAPKPTMKSSRTWLRLSISDTGCGIDSRILKRIFEPFFTTKEVGQGTGLGLSVVHGIVTAHDGHIEVKRRPGGGTRFDIFLPGLESGPAGVHDERTSP